MWGKIKSAGDDWMYPKPLMDLRSSYSLFFFIRKYFLVPFMFFLSIILLKVLRIVCFFSYFLGKIVPFYSA